MLNHHLHPCALKHVPEICVSAGWIAMWCKRLRWKLGYWGYLHAKAYFMGGR